MKKILVKNIVNKGLSGYPANEINEIKETIKQNDKKYMWLDRSNQHILKAPFIGKRETNYLGLFNDCIRCYKGGSGELSSEIFITPFQISFKLFDETYYREGEQEGEQESKARVPREIFIYNREGAIELWSSGEVLVRDPNNFTSKKYVDIVVGDNIHNVNQKIEATNNEVATIKQDLGDLGNQVVDVQNNSAKINAPNTFTRDQYIGSGARLEFNGNRNSGDFLIRANIDQVSRGRYVDILRVHSEGPKATLRVSKDNPWKIYTPHDSTRLELNYAPTEAKHAANKEYVDNAIANSGGSTKGQWVVMKSENVNAIPTTEQNYTLPANFFEVGKQYEVELIIKNENDKLFNSTWIVTYQQNINWLYGPLAFYTSGPDFQNEKKLKVIVGTGVKAGVFSIKQPQQITGINSYSLRIRKIG